jgi:hypothetical protein
MVSFCPHQVRLIMIEKIKQFNKTLTSLLKKVDLKVNSIEEILETKSSLLNKEEKEILNKWLVRPPRVISFKILERLDENLFLIEEQDTSQKLNLFSEEFEKLTLTPDVYNSVYKEHIMYNGICWERFN